MKPIHLGTAGDIGQEMSLLVVRNPLLTCRAVFNFCSFDIVLPFYREFFSPFIEIPHLIFPSSDVAGLVINVSLFCLGFPNKFLTFQTAPLGSILRGTTLRLLENTNLNPACNRCPW